MDFGASWGAPGHSWRGPGGAWEVQWETHGGPMGPPCRDSCPSGQEIKESVPPRVSFLKLLFLKLQGGGVASQGEEVRTHRHDRHSQQMASRPELQAEE